MVKEEKNAVKITSLTAQDESIAGKTHVENSVPVDETSAFLNGWKLAAVTISLALGMFLTGIDGSIIGVATPGITTSFQAIDDLSWYGSGYMLPHTVLQPILGSFYKAFNAKYIYVLSIIIFELGSCICAAAPTSSAFIIGRVIAGCGAAGLLQGTLTIVGYSVPKQKVPLYYGYVLSVQGISACTAPIVGGIFTDRLTWRWCFWL
jgi:MFS family permease